MRLFRTALFPVVAISALATSLTFAGAAAAQGDSTVKTDSMPKLAIDMEQGIRGREVFAKTCLECHTMSDVTGIDFKLKWHSQAVYELLDVIRTTMPDDKPGSLTPDQYIDVVAYLLRMNGADFGGAVLVPTDTASLKKWKMQIMVPPPKLDSAMRDTTKKDTTKVDAPRKFGVKPASTPGFDGVNHLFTRQGNKP